jgi:RHS repeat-associated protein
VVRADSCTASADVCIEFNMNTYQGNWYPPDEEDISLGGGFTFEPDRNLYPKETKSWGYDNGNRSGRAVSLKTVKPSSTVHNVDGSAAGRQVAADYRASHPELTETPQQRYDEAQDDAPGPHCEPGMCGEGDPTVPQPTCELPTDTGPRVEPGAEPKDGPGSDPVDARDGEYYTTETDLSLDGAGVRYAQVRSYRSRLDFDGTMGFAWDHSMNQRIVPSRSTSCQQEVLYMTGKGTTVRFRYAGEMIYFPTQPGNAPEYAITYTSPPGYQGVLRGHKRTHAAGSGADTMDVTAVIWTLTWPDGTVGRFDTDGNLRRLEDANGIGLSLQWDRAPAPIFWRVAQVTDSGGRTIGYDYNGDGLLREVWVKDTDLKADYEYVGHDLSKVTKASGRTELYLYDAGHADNGDLPAFVPEGQLQGACELACAPSSSSCDAGGGCDEALKQCDDACAGCNTNCVDQCPSACADACSAGSPASPGCTAICAPECTAPKLNELCQKLYRGEITSGDGSSRITPQLECEACDDVVEEQCSDAHQNDCNMIGNCLYGCILSLASSEVDYGQCVAECVGSSLNPLNPDLYKEIGKEIGITFGIAIMSAWEALDCWGGKIVELGCWLFGCEYEADCDVGSYLKRWRAEDCNQHCLACLAYGDSCAEGSCQAGHSCEEQCYRGFMGEDSGTSCEVPGNNLPPTGGLPNPPAGGCPAQLAYECPRACAADCLGNCTPRCEPECEASCATECSTCRPTCEAEVLPACKAGCVDGCIARAHDEGGGMRFGKPSDLNHNLTQAYYVGDLGMPILFLDLTYGTNTGLPDFDTVITQKNGDDTLTFRYRDYDAEAHGLPRPTDLVTIGNTVDASTYQSVDICPGACTTPSAPPYDGIFYPVGHMIATFRAASSTALTPVRLLGSRRTPIPLTTFRFEKPDPAKPAVYARSLAGMAELSNGFRLSVVVSGKRVVLDRDPSNSDRLVVTAASTTLDLLVGTIKEITVFTDRGGLLRAVVGHPSALLSIAEGDCTRPFTATLTRDRQLQLTPTDACSRDVVVAPLATAVPYATALPKGLSGSIEDLAKADLFTGTALAPGRFSVRWTASMATAGLYVPSPGAQDGAAPTGLAQAAYAAAEEAPLLRAPVAGLTDRDVYVFHVPGTMRADGLPFRSDLGLPSGPVVASGQPFPLFDLPFEWHTGSQVLCPLILFTGPVWGEPGAVAGRPARATIEVDSYGVAWTSYFDHDGQLVREKNTSTGATRSFNYDSHRNLTGVLQPLGDRSCLSYDAHGNLTGVAKHAIPNALGSTADIVEKFEYAGFPARLTKIFDPRDLTSVLRRFEYDAKGNLTKVHEATGEETLITPNGAGLPETVVEPGGSITKFTYSPYASAPKDTTVDAGGGAPQTTSRTFDYAGRLIREVTPFGVTTDISWEAMHPLQIDLAAEGGLASTMKITYNKDGQVATTAQDGLRIEHSYDKLGRENTVTASGTGITTRKTCDVYGPDRRLLERVFPDGSRAQFFYDGEGRPTITQAGALDTPYSTACGTYQGSSPLAAVLAQTVYDVNGRPVTAIDSQGRSTRITYDGFGRAIIIRADVPGGAVVRRGYDAMGHIAWEALYSSAAATLAYGAPALADAGLLAVTEYGYDAAGRQNKTDRWAFYPVNKQLIGDGHQITQTTLQPGQRKLTLTDDLGQTTVQQFDGLGRLSQTTSPGGQQIAYDYLDAGKTVRERWPAPTPTGQLSRTTKYTAWGAPSSVSVQSAATPVRQWSYYPNGTVQTITEASGLKTTFEWDPLRRLQVRNLEHGDGTREKLSFDYAVTDRVTKRTSTIERNSTSTAYDYDALGRLVSTTFPTGVSRSIDYIDGTTLPANEVTPVGVHLKHSYRDSTQGRVHKVVATGAPWGDQQREYQFDPLGQLVSARDSAEKFGDTSDDFVTSLAYDSLGLVYSETDRVPGSPDNVVTASRDGLGRPTTVNIAGTAVSRSYDANNRLTTVRLGSSTSASEATFAYNGLGGPTTRTLRSFLVTTYSYDELGRLTGLKDGTISDQHWYRPIDGVPRFTTNRRSGDTFTSVFAVDQNARLHEEGQDLRTIGSVASSLAPDATWETAAQLVATAFGANENYPHRKWQLDGRDNWTSVSGGPDASTTIDDDDQYGTFGNDVVSNNADGSVAKLNNEVYQWNAFGELAMASKADKARRYGRDAFGRVVEETDVATGAKTRFGYEGLARVIERNAAGTAITVNGAGPDQHILRLVGTQKYYFHQDAQGSVYLLTNTGGNPVEWYKYNAYGLTTFQNASGVPVATTPSGNRFAFQGAPYDADLGLVDMRARPYRPAWGRFLSPDPSDYGDGSNRFAFVGSAPTAWTDPLGLGREDPAFEARWDQAVRDARAELTRFGIEQMNDAVFWENVHSYVDPVHAYLHDSADRFNHTLWNMSLGPVSKVVNDVATEMCGDPGCLLLLGPFALLGEAGEAAALSQSVRLSVLADEAVTAPALEGLGADGEAAGAFGKGWPVFDETASSVAIRQSGPTTCGAACGSMAAGGTVTEEELLTAIGHDAPIGENRLVQALESTTSQGWKTDYFNSIQGAVSEGNGSIIVKVLDSNARAHHWLVVDGIANDTVLIRDPWDGSMYKMMATDFEKIFTGIAVFH